jgi:hypothetical protein
MKYAIFCALYLFSVISIGAQTTELLFYRPFEQPSEQKITRLAGECKQQSMRTIREDAWRCEAKGKMFDPCFAPMGNQENILICPHSPWNSADTEIEVPKPLDNLASEKLDMSRNYPWALELADGKRCIAVEPGKVYDAMPIHYACNDAQYLFGTIQRCHMPWTTLQRSTSGTHTVEIKKAWF